MGENLIITIEAEFVRETDRYWLLDCEGEVEYFPKSICEFDNNKRELKAPEWLLKKKFPGEF